MKLYVAIFAFIMCLSATVFPIGPLALADENIVQTMVKTKSAERQAWILAGGIVVAGIAVGAGIYFSRKPPKGN